MTLDYFVILNSGNNTKYAEYVAYTNSLELGNTITTCEVVTII